MQTQNPVRRTFGRPGRWAIVSIAGAALALGGCTETDSFLYDQSIIGRFEHTPTRVPILSRIISIEGPEDEGIEHTDPSEADLVPEVTEYRIGAGDRLQVAIFDLPEEGGRVEYPRIVDPRGFIELPQLGQVYVNAMTSAAAEEAIKAKMKAWVARPLATVLVDAKRAERFSVQGAVQNPGQYGIPAPNFKLLEALSSSGTFSEAGEYIYVIRQIPLTDAVSGRPVAPKAAPQENGGDAAKPTGEQLIDTINRLNKPEAPKPEAPKPETPKSDAPKPSGSPGMFQPPAKKPEIDLPPKAGEPAKQPAAPAQPESGDTSWVNIDGKWVKVKKPAGTGVQAPMPMGRPTQGEQLVTQRIIRVPIAPLVGGDARYNIIIRAGDVVRVPPSPPGTIYMGGQIARAGAYGVAEKLTLTRAIKAAGGLTGLAVPERVDLVRMVGSDRQAIIRLNLRAIEEGTNPDIFLKANDQINIGTNFWALPMAVIRNGFRMTYGFGFLADRNFGNDIFGAPPTNSLGQ